MIGSIIISSIWFEIGSWFGFGVAKFGSRDKVRNILISGSDVRTSIPIADDYIAQQTVKATRLERVIASRIASAARAFTNTKAFELIILQKAIETRTKRVKMLPTSVRLVI